MQGLIDLERQRIESTNRRTEVIRYAIETNDAADKRQFDFQMAKLQNDADASRRRHRLARNAILGGGAVVVVVVGFLLDMTFFGTPEQSSMALAILRTLGIGLGGYGVIGGIVATIRRALENATTK